MNSVFQITLDFYVELIELARNRGKKVGDSMESEFKELLEKYKNNDKIKHLGLTNQDIDLLTGNLREKGKKVFNIAEYRRKNENDLGENKS